ncbi:MAG TPA: DUF87 domain-containing protein [Stellaceae bacterium]|nr:DUF87 domain-containing protein [Stellaceae bacterium]
MPAKSSRAAALRVEDTRGSKDRAADMEASILSADALDDRIAIVGTAGSGKTYTAKGFVERLLETGARVAVIDPLGVWWGLRASADGGIPGYPVVVFGGRHADVAITAQMGAALGRLIAGQALACVVDLSELGSSAARRRFMAAFAEALYEANGEPLHLVLDEADLWAPQRPIKGWEGLLGHIEEIVRRGRVRGFIPWLITQRPAVVHKDVLSQADILIAMKLTASQDRDAVGAWIEGQADRQEGKRILGELPRLKQGEGYLWAPGHGILQRVRFPAIRTFDSSRTPRRGERLAVPRTLAESLPRTGSGVDLTAIVAALAAVETGATDKAPEGPAQGPLARDEAARRVELKQELAVATARIVTLEEENRALASRLAEIAVLANGSKEALPISAPALAPIAETKPPHSPRVGANARPSDGPRIEARGGLHPAAQKLLTALAQHAPARFTWGQAATLAGLKPSGGHFNAGRKELRAAGYVAETDGLVMPTPDGMNAAGEVPAAPSTPAERLTLWCDRLPAPAPEMLRTLAAQGERYIDAGELAKTLGKKPTGGHWNSGIAILRNNGLIETEPAAGTPGSKRYRAATLFRNCH